MRTSSGDAAPRITMLPSTTSPIVDSAASAACPSSALNASRPKTIDGVPRGPSCDDERDGDQ
jgi:hypothetical protein